RLFERLPRIELMLLVGGYAQRWHLKENARGGVTATVEDWRAILEGTDRPRCLPLPHPSWRNNAWLNARPWFEEKLVRCLQAEVRALLA
ncbi:MAG TPA: uracil-DNA glycosylase family protein, partial [Methyloceanibacter sp.]